LTNNLRIKKGFLEEKKEKNIFARAKLFAAR